MSVKDITENDLSEMEEYSKRLPNILRQALKLETRKNFVESMKNLAALFFGIYSNGVGFKFPPGDKKLIILIAKMVSEKLAEKGYAFFQLSSVSHFDDRQLIPTPVGNLFRDDRSSKWKRSMREEYDGNISEEESLSAKNH